MTKEIRPGRLCPSCSPFIRRTCTGYDWFPINEIRYCSYQMMFLIEHRLLLQEGKYPPDPYVSGYVGGGFSGRKSHAPFERALQEVGELDARCLTMEVGARLCASNLSRKLLIAEIEGGRTIRELSAEARLFLRYISGWERRLMSFSAWSKQTRYRAKMNTRSYHKQRIAGTI